MLWISCAGVWAALCVSFVVSAAIIGMPAASIAYEVVRGALLLVAIVGAGAGVHHLVLERRRDRPKDAILGPFGGR